jgi:hypothetical protein
LLHFEFFLGVIFEDHLILGLEPDVVEYAFLGQVD